MQAWHGEARTERERDWRLEGVTVFEKMSVGQPPSPSHPISTCVEPAVNKFP